MTTTDTDFNEEDAAQYLDTGGQVAISNDDGTIELLPPRQPVNLGVLDTLRDHVSAMRDAKFFADGICYTTMVPDRFQGKPGDGAAAILFGAELGLSPIASLRSVIVIHGTPGLEARTMKALLKVKGYRFKTHEASDTAYDIEAWTPDGDECERSRWTIEDARRAGYAPKPSGPDSQQRPGVQSDWETVSRNGKTSVVGNMKYITDPRAMLKAKATAEVCRDIAPHILLGLPYAAEELEDDFAADDGLGIQEQARPPRRARGVNRLRERAAEAQHPEVVDAEQLPNNDFRENGEPREESGMEGGSHGRYEKATTEPAPGSAAEPAVKQPAAEAAPAPAPTKRTPADIANERDQAGADYTASEAPGDIAMSPAMRAKGERLLGALLGEAKVDGIDWTAVVSEIVAKRGGPYRNVEAPDDLTNGELKDAVDALQEWKGKGKLYDYCGEALNAASLRDAGMLGQ